MRQDAALGVMLYARYGRAGVEMMQSVFRDMGLGQDEDSLRIVKETLSSLPADHPLTGYLSLAPDLASDAGLVDTFLHGRDRSFTVADCLELVNSAGLFFQDWFLRSPYYPPLDPSNAFFAQVRLLPREQQWSVMEEVNSRNACHFFMACRPDRDVASYAIDFDGADALDFVPSFRHRCGVSGRHVFGPDWGTTLDPLEARVMQQVDGVRSIRQIIANVVAVTGAGQQEAEAQQRGLRLMQSLWQMDVLAAGRG